MTGVQTCALPIYILTIKSWDVAGNSAMSSYSYSQDTRVPDVSADGTAAGWRISVIGPIHLSASDPVPG